MDNVTVVKDRRHHFHTYARAYDNAASETTDRGRRLTVASAGMSAVVSSAIFASANAGEISQTWVWIAGAVSLAAAVLAAVAAALGYSDAATSYRQAALQFIRLEHRADLLIAKADVRTGEVEALDEEADAVAAAVKVVPDRYYRKAEKDVDERRDADEFERTRRAGGRGRAPAPRTAQKV